MTERFELRHVALTPHPHSTSPVEQLHDVSPWKERKQRNNDAASEISETKRF
jgi:hypothetical protein